MVEVCLHTLVSQAPGIIDAKDVEDDEGMRCRATQNVQSTLQILSDSLPREQTKDGVFALLMPIQQAKFKLPRQMPIPEMKKTLTRWEKFARAKGINPKRKKETLVFDPVAQDWKLNRGIRSAKKAQEKREFLIEHKDGDNPYVDPFALKAEEKALQKAKQKLRTTRNKVEAAGYRMPR